MDSVVTNNSADEVTPGSTPSTADAGDVLALILESNIANLRLRQIVSGMWLLAFFSLGEGYQKPAQLLMHNVRFYLKFVDDPHMRTALTLFDRFDGFMEMIGAEKLLRFNMYNRFRAKRFPGLSNAP